jgi:rubrerythrin
MELDSRLTGLEILGVAIRAEVDAAESYQQLARMVKNHELKAKIEFLKDEELKHERILKELYQHDYPTTALKLPARDFLPELSFTIVEGMTVPEIFKKAMAAEKVSEDFYAQAVKKAQAETGRRMLSYLSAMERSHYYLLNSEYELLVQFDDYHRVEKWTMVHVGP